MASFNNAAYAGQPVHGTATGMPHGFPNAGFAAAALFGATSAVTVPLNGISANRRWNVSVQTVGAGGQASSQRGLGFDETFPQQLTQVWSGAEWGAFISAANNIVERHLAGLYSWRYAAVFAPFLIMIIAMAIIVPVFISGGPFMFAPVVIVGVFFLILGTQLNFWRAYRSRLDAALADLATHCQATNQNHGDRGLSWSVKQAQASRRSIAVWLQGDFSPQPATGRPYTYTAEPASYGHLAAAYGQPTATGTPLPAYPVTGAHATPESTDYSAATTSHMWPSNAQHSTPPPVASAPQFPKTGAPDLNWPV